MPLKVSPSAHLYITLAVPAAGLNEPGTAVKGANVAIQLLRELFDASDAHRRAHGEGCTVFPSPQAPLWGIIAAALPAARVLEVGCGIGYQAACIATTAPSCRVETIEGDPMHADLAEQEFVRRGLEARVTVLRGDAETLLPKLDGPYDLVVEDAGIDYARWLRVLTRLVRPDGVLITRNLSKEGASVTLDLPTNATTIIRARPAS
ncbi:MAG: class I SAM-dependent methyltransferase [Chloroflexi bacterium]|nr:class I SAM-dependent methyltransferase [Chloroflexota bacterium]